MLVVPKTLDADLLAGCGLSLAEYIVLVNLSETPGGPMRMNELAAQATLSASGVTRLVERMERQGGAGIASAPGGGAVTVEPQVRLRLRTLSVVLGVSRR